MKCSIIVFIIIGLLGSTLAGNILIFHLISTGSYVSVMNAMLQTLAEHHNITLYSIVHDDYPHPNVTVVPMKVPPMKNFFSTGLFEMLCDTGVYYITWKTVMSVTEDHAHNIYREKNFQKLLATKPTNYDVLMTFATFSEYSLQMAHVLKLPLIQISPTTPLNHVNNAVGNPTFMTTSPNMFSQEPHNSFYNRVKIYLKHLYGHLRYIWVYMPMINRVTSQYLPPGTPPAEVAQRNTSVLFVNMNSAMGFARPFMPNMVEIGTIHCRPGNPLPQKLEEFISGSGEHGIIYLSFGSSIRSKFPDYIKQAILRVFERLPQRILWKWNEEMTGLPANVRVSKWFPQQDVLAHNKTRLFVTQGGMFSMQEGIYHGVPSLVIPIAFDQQTNCIMGKELGYSEYINFCEFTEEKFTYWIHEMIANPKYKFNAVRLSKLTRDQPLTIREKIRWWTDYVIRHRGNPVVDQIEDKSSGLTRMDVDIVLFLYTSILITLIAGSYTIIKILKFVQNQKYIVIKEKST